MLCLNLKLFDWMGVLESNWFGVPLKATFHQLYVMSSLGIYCNTGVCSIVSVATKGVRLHMLYTYFNT